MNAPDLFNPHHPSFNRGQLKYIHGTALVNIYQLSGGQEDALIVVFANFRGVNTFTMSDITEQEGEKRCI